MPYPFRRPGQRWSLAVNAAVLRYINSRTIVTAETEFHPQRRSAFSITEAYELPYYLMRDALSLAQDIFGSRKIENRLSVGPILPVGPRIDLYNTLRHRQVVGKSRSGHQTIGGGITIRNRGQFRYLGYDITGDYEVAPKTTSPDFQYDRRYAIADLLASVPSYFDYRLRFFRGEFTSNGEVPDELFFYPEDLSLSRLRLDVPGLPRTGKLYSVGNDLYLPFSLGIGSGSLILNRRLRWRAFYDYGESLDIPDEYRAAGGGLLVPLGGDLSGVGTLSLSRLNFLVVAYSLAEGEVSRKPRFLFTFGADL